MRWTVPTPTVGRNAADFAVYERDTTAGGGRVYAFGNTGKEGDGKEVEQKDVLWCFDAGTGAEIWNHAYVSPLLPKNYEGGPNATPTVEAGRVYQPRTAQGR